MLIKCTFLWLIQLINCQQNMEPFIVEGQDARIEQHPHSAYMCMSCSKGPLVSRFRCGASILNQWILLTAAHCFDCQSPPEAMFTVGSSHIRGTFVTSAQKYIVHPKYQYSTQSSDIALVRLKSSLPLSERVSRVALMRKPPYNEPATVAGWGVNDDKTRTASNHLKFIRQRTLPYTECVTVLQRMPKGCICASNRQNPGSYASLGDSGSALVVRGYIQIGIVAFKRPDRSLSVVAYTDTGYFYDWIMDAAKSLFCQ